MKLEATVLALLFTAVAGSALAGAKVPVPPIGVGLPVLVAMAIGYLAYRVLERRKR